MKPNFIQAVKAYYELFRSGEIRTLSEGDSVSIAVHGNICGDILVFIGPNRKNSEGENTMEMLANEANLQQQVKIALDAFRLKLNGLTLLPVTLVWMLNIGLYLLFFSRYFKSIYGSLAGNNFISAIGHILPLLTITVASVFFGKNLGFLLLKPVLTFISWIVKILRRR